MFFLPVIIRSNLHLTIFSCKRLSRQAFALDVEDGFCSNKIGRTIAAFIAIDCVADLEVKALNNFAAENGRVSGTQVINEWVEGVARRQRFQCRAGQGM